MHHAAYASTSAAVVKAVHEAYPEAISKPHYSGCYALFVNVWCIVNLLFVYLIYVQFAVRLYCQNKFFFRFMHSIYAVWYVLEVENWEMVLLLLSKKCIYFISFNRN